MKKEKIKMCVGEERLYLPSRALPYFSGWRGEQKARTARKIESCRIDSCRFSIIFFPPFHRVLPLKILLVRNLAMVLMVLQKFGGTPFQSPAIANYSIEKGKKEKGRKRCNAGGIFAIRSSYIPPYKNIGIMLWLIDCFRYDNIFFIGTDFAVTFQIFTFVHLNCLHSTDTPFSFAERERG
ncbi:hypothetical protein ABW19_dt0205379 [Dactylella cylindrospora]|nr:hypothetical protein ABW19_dt0205379 [Dactylella cylindrospora]